MSKRQRSRVIRANRVRELAQSDGEHAVGKFLHGAAEHFDAGGEAALRQWIDTELKQLKYEDQTELVAILLGFSFEAGGMAK